MRRSATDGLRELGVLVLCRSMLPIGRVSIRDAAVLLVLGKAQPVDLEGGRNWVIRSVRLRVEVTEQIVLVGVTARHLWKSPPVSRKEILRRDKHTCQYCGSSRGVTIDHVFPKSRGGKDSWTNLVAACAACNGKKGNRTPQEAGMTLRCVPRSPVHPLLKLAGEEQFLSKDLQSKVSCTTP